MNFAMDIKVVKKGLDSYEQVSCPIGYESLWSKQWKGVQEGCDLGENTVMTKELYGETYPSKPICPNLIRPIDPIEQTIFSGNLICVLRRDLNSYMTA